MIEAYIEDLAEVRAVLQIIREQRKDTIQDVHRATGLTYNTIKRTEQAEDFNPSVEVVIKLLDHYGYQLHITPRED